MRARTSAPSSCSASSTPRRLRAHQFAIERSAGTPSTQRCGITKPLLRPLHAGDLDARLRAAPAAITRPRARLPRGLPAVTGRPGALAVVLHTHMPYVEGFGTWPFGEEWLWEAIATSYLPVLDVLDGRRAVHAVADAGPLRPARGARARERCAALPARRASRLARARRRRPAARPGGRTSPPSSSAPPASTRARSRSSSGGGDLLGALAPHAALDRAARRTRSCRCWRPTPACGSSSRPASTSHRARFGARWRGGFWLPECAHEPWLDPLLEEAGVHAACVELTTPSGPATSATSSPLRSAAGPLLVPIDRELIDLVWGPGGYPSRARLPRRAPPHRPRPQAVGQRRRDLRPRRGARSTRSTRRRRRARRALRERVAGGGLCTLAFDTELFGHRWYEGPAFLDGVRAGRDARGVALAHLDDALERHEPRRRPGRALDGATRGPRRRWDSPAVAAGRGARPASATPSCACSTPTGAAAGARARVRELLALQASDWAFLETRALAGDYALRAQRSRPSRRAATPRWTRYPPPTPSRCAASHPTSPAPLLEP